MIKSRGAGSLQTFFLAFLGICLWRQGEHGGQLVHWVRLKMEDWPTQNGHFNGEKMMIYDDQWWSIFRQTHIILELRQNRSQLPRPCLAKTFSWLIRSMRCLSFKDDVLVLASTAQYVPQESKLQLRFSHWLWDAMMRCCVHSANDGGFVLGWQTASTRILLQL